MRSTRRRRPSPNSVALALKRLFSKHGILYLIICFNNDVLNSFEFVFFKFKTFFIPFCVAAFLEYQKSKRWL